MIYIYSPASTWVIMKPELKKSLVTVIDSGKLESCGLGTCLPGNQRSLKN